MTQEVDSWTERVLDALTGGAHRGRDGETQRRIIMAVGICVIGAAALVPMGVGSLHQGLILLGVADLTAAALLVLLLLYFRRGGDHDRAINLGVLLTGLLFFCLFVTGGASDTGHLWYFVFPLVASFLLGARRGAIAAAALFVPSLLLLTLPRAWPLPAAYDASFLGRFVPALLVVSIYSYAFERSRERADLRLRERNERLKRTFQELVAAQQSLEESEEKHRQLVENANDGIAVVESGRLRFVNPRLAEMVGRPAEEITGRRFAEFIHPGERARVSAYYERRMSGEDVPGRYETVVLRKGESSLDVELNAALVSYKGEPADLVVVRDITERKQAENAIRQARDAAEAANRAKTQFLANMSHEIRTPMNGVMGMAELLLDSRLSSKQRRFAETIQRSARSLLQIVNDILDTAKIEAGKFTLQRVDFDPHAIIEDVVGLLAETAESKGLELVCEIEEGVPVQIRGDAERLRQVIINLTGNAIKFTKSGRVFVRASSEGSTTDGALLRVAVEDTGIGISPDEMGSIFESFVQADGTLTRSFGGSGLGLSISRELVEMMGGTIGVKSEVGVGSTFWFTLPVTCVKEEPQSTNQKSQQQAFAHAGARQFSRDIRVLVAEDCEINQEVAVGMLQALGCCVTVASDGKEALRALSESRFDLVLMDCQMPGLDGYAATRRFRAREGLREGVAERRLPIVALTAHAMVGAREECLQAGMDDYLAKPFDLEKLRDVLDLWVMRRRSADLGVDDLDLEALARVPVERGHVDRVRFHG